MTGPRKPGEGEIDPTPGLAGGPGPTPPGIEDGTAEPRLAEPERMGPPPSAAEQQAEGEAAERAAAVRTPDVPGAKDGRERRDAEDPDVRKAEERTRR